MGSGTSRGKKVAPECVTKSGAGVASTKEDRSPFKPLETHGALRNASHRAQPDCNSDGHDSDFSEMDGNVDGQLERPLADPEDLERASAKKTCSKKSFIRSKTYGLCHFGQEDAREDVTPDPRLQASGGAAEPRVTDGGSKDVNKRDSSVPQLKQCNHACAIQMDSSSQSFLTRRTLMETVPTSEKQQTFGSCHSSFPTMPVIQYDGSEEELMDSIEREFS